VTRTYRPLRGLTWLVAAATFAAGSLGAQILTTDAGVRSPELPSIRALLRSRHYDNVDDLRFRANAVYSLTPNLEVEALLPMISRHIDVGAGSLDLVGLGDTSLRAKFALLRDDGVMTSNRIALLGRAILPTGDSSSTINGQPLHPRLRLGLGSFGFGLGAASTIVRDRHRASVTLEWQHRGGHSGFDPGDEFELDMAYWFRLSPARFNPSLFEPEWRAVVEVQSRYASRDRGPGLTLSDRGIQVDGIVGLQLNAGTSLRCELGVLAPLVDDLRTPFGDTGFGMVFGVTFYF
jgi:hypothetical protein